PEIRLRHHGGDADRFGGLCDPVPLPAFLLPSRPLSARDARPAALLLTADGCRILGARGGLRPTRDLEALLTQPCRMVAGRLRSTAPGDGGGLQEPAERRPRRAGRWAEIGPRRLRGRRP